MKGFFSILLVVLLLVSFTCIAYASETGGDDTGGILSKLWGFFSNFFNDAWNFVVGLFVPSEDYFSNQMQHLQDKVNEKMGGVGYLYNMVKNFFSSLSKESTATPLVFSIPDDYLFKGNKGFSIDFLASGAVYIKLFRNVVDVLVCLGTAMVCYKKLTALFSG